MRLLSFFSLLFFLHFTTKGQCDVAITGVDLNTYEVTIEVINSAGCIAAPIGGTPGKVSQIQIGYHLPEPINPDNEIIEDFNETFGLPPCSPQWDANGYYLGQNPNSNHPGWWYSPSTSTTFDADIMGSGLVTGDVVTIPLNPPGNYDVYPSPTAECGDDLIDYWVSEGECIEFVLWQINYGNTWYQGNGGWASLASNPDFAPGSYQDQNCNNSWYMCRDENPGAAVASPDFDCPPDAPDAVIDDVVFEIGCIGDSPAYSITFTVWNYGNEDITNYCIEIWNEDYYVCFDDSLFGGYGIPVGEGQTITTPFFEYAGLGSFFTLSVDNVNDEIVTGNNNTTVYYPDELEDLVCPEVCEPDTVEIETITYIYQIDSIFITDTVIDTLYFELPPDTLIQYVDNFIYDTTYVDNYIYDTTYVYTVDTIYVETPIIYGCTWPVSCNYNDEATVDDGSCLDCDTPYEVGAILCDAYHGIDGYWDWWIDLKGCDIEPPIEQCDTIYIELPPDTLILTQIDTITIVETELIYDTLYIDNYIYEYDTIYVTETEYITDTLIVTLTDTITEYIVQEILIDCNTGLPCDEEPPGIDLCPDWTTIHIPNTFTPNNDGHNDVWQIIYDLDCWENIEFRIFNRWGAEIYYGEGDWFDSYPFWDGSVNGGNHYVSDGVYVYLVKGKKVGSAEVVEATGHISVFR